MGEVNDFVGQETVAKTEDAGTAAETFLIHRNRRANTVLDPGGVAVISDPAGFRRVPTPCVRVNAKFVSLSHQRVQKMAITTDDPVRRPIVVLYLGVQPKVPAKADLRPRSSFKTLSVTGHVLIQILETGPGPPRVRIDTPLVGFDVNTYADRN